MSRLPDELSRRLDELAALPKCPEGELPRLAFATGCSTQSLRVIVHRKRLAMGRAPRATASRYSLAFLTPEQRAEYERLRTYRYPRDEALSMIGATPP